MYNRDPAHKLGLIFLLVPVVILVGLMVVAYGWGIWHPIEYVRDNLILQLGVLVSLVIGYLFLRYSDSWPPGPRKRGIDRFL